jgi:hypothetical protein
VIIIANIDIDEKAYDELKKLLSLHKEYNCVRFSYVNSCCSKATIDIILDEYFDKEKVIPYKDMMLLIDDQININIKSIQLIYSNNSFQIKCEPIKKACTSCSNKTSGCNGCHK